MPLLSILATTLSRDVTCPSVMGGWLLDWTLVSTSKPGGNASFILDGLFCPLFSIEPANSSLQRCHYHIGYGNVNAKEQLMIKYSHNGMVAASQRKPNLGAVISDMESRPATTARW